MDWIIEPITGFIGLFEPIVADQCSGGAELRNRTCTGGLLVCDCSGGLIQKPKSL